MVRLYGKRVDPKDKVNIAGREYTLHAEERMEDRHFVPSVINYVIDNPDETYNLEGNENKGYVTRAYVKRGIADINPEAGKIGERIISVRNPSSKRDYKSVVVLTDDDNVIRTIEVLDEDGLSKFIANNVSSKKSGLESVLKVAIGGCFLLSILFISRITGNAISNLNGQTSSLFGFGFLTIGLILGFFYLKGKRR